MSVTQVPLQDLKRIHDPIEAELKNAFERVLHANSYIMGPELTQFEQACAEYLGVKHAIGCSSGTDTLLLAMMALEIGPGDEVICPSYTFFATAGSIWRLGAKPVFVDSDPLSFNCDIADIKTKITSKTKAIMPVHLFGLAADLDPLLALSQEFDIPVIEDAAQAIGARYKEQMVGSVGTFGSFSFFPAKNLGGFGDGGLLTTHNDSLAEKARVLRAHGSKPKYHHHLVGGNFRLDALQAALLNVKLPYCDRYAEQRRQNADDYARKLQNLPLTLPVAPNADYYHVYNQYVIQLESPATRNRLEAHLQAKKIGTAIYYPIPLHLQACFRSLGYQKGDLPICERLAETTLALPIFPGMTAAEMDYVCQAIHSFFA